MAGPFPLISHPRNPHHPPHPRAVHPFAVGPAKAHRTCLGPPSARHTDPSRRRQRAVAEKGKALKARSFRSWLKAAVGRAQAGPYPEPSRRRQRGAGSASEQPAASSCRASISSQLEAPAQGSRLNVSARLFASNPTQCSPAERKKTPPGATRAGRIQRMGWDSNPRYAFTYTHFPGVRLKPLGHPSQGRATRRFAERTG